MLLVLGFPHMFDPFFSLHFDSVVLIWSDSMNLHKASEVLREHFVARFHRAVKLKLHFLSSRPVLRFLQLQLLQKASCQISIDLCSQRCISVSVRIMRLVLIHILGMHHLMRFVLHGDVNRELLVLLLLFRLKH